MIRPVHDPLLVLLVAIVLLALSVWAGARVLRRNKPLEADLQQGLSVLTAVMTLLSIGRITLVQKPKRGRRAIRECRV